VTERIRVIQWTTGNVGTRSLRAIASDPRFELVGCYAHSTAKVGRDAGELVGIAPLGVIATDDAEALLALRADCVAYMPVYPDVDEMVQILESGANVVTTSAFITGRSLGAEAVDALSAACERGSSSLYGTGVNPGLANVFALVSSGICERVDRISMEESVDASGYESEETQRSVGFGEPIDRTELPAMARRGTAVFQDAVALTADAIGVALDDVRFDVEFAAAATDMDLGFMQIPRGCVAGIRACWSGIVAGRPVVELRVCWKMGAPLEPDWPLRHGYSVEIVGRPNVRSRLQVMPPADWDEPDFGGLGMIMTAMPAVNAIPAVVAASPGIVASHHLPVIAGQTVERTREPS
jgi:hypothetical protein